jgi:hypothetical protein
MVVDARTSQLKAQLRAAVFSTLSQQEGISSDATNPKLAALMASSDGPLVVSLLVEFLDFFNLKYTASVLLPESNVAEALSDRQQLAKELGLPAVNSGSSVLQEVLAAYRNGGGEKKAVDSDRQPAVSLRDEDYDFSTDTKPAEPVEISTKNKEEDRPKSRMSAAESVEEDYDEDFEEDFEEDSNSDQEEQAGGRGTDGGGIQGGANNLAPTSESAPPRARRGLLGALPTLSRPTTAPLPALTPALDMDQSVDDSQALDLYDSVNSISMGGAGTDDDFVQSSEHVDVDQSFNFDASADPSVDGSQALDAYDFVQPIQPLGS